MSAVDYKLQDIGGSKTCPGASGLMAFCEPSCYNVFTHVGFWMHRTPEFQLVIVLVSKPLPLLVALWGMTTGRMRANPASQQRSVHSLGTLTAQSKCDDARVRMLTKVKFWRRGRA